MNNYHQSLEAEENKDEDEEDDTSKRFDEIVRKRTLSDQSNGDSPSTKDDDDKNKMNGVAEGKG